MSKAWFAPKRYGYGAGLPISWEGWAVLIGFFASAWAVHYFTRLLLPPADAVIAQWIGLLMLIAALVWIARVKTEGGWHWRNGGQ